MEKGSTYTEAMRTSQRPDEPEHAPVPKYLVPGLVAGLITWGLYLAIGAAFPEQGISPSVEAGDVKGISTTHQADEKAVDLQPQSDRSSFRPWRGVVVLACSAIFLAWFWGLQRLYARRHPG